MNKIVCRLFFIVFILGTTFSVEAQIITTVAGTGVAGFSGDDGSAFLAQVKNPSCMASDSLGNVYFTDQYNNRIRRIDRTGIITTIAGSGPTGFNGDNRSALEARLSQPSGMVLDDSLNIYIADAGNHRIRKISAVTGLISTIAGTGVAGFTGDNGSALLARLNTPSSVAIDGKGNVFFSDALNSRIRKVDANGTITTISGNGTFADIGDGGLAKNATINRTAAIAFDHKGNLYLVEQYSNIIRKIDTAGIITKFAGKLNAAGQGGDGELAVNAGMTAPAAIAFDPNDNAYIADCNSYKIRKVDTNGIMSTVAGAGSPGHTGDGGDATVARIYSPLGLTLDKYNNLYFAERGNYIRYVFINKILPTDSTSFEIFPNPTKGDFNVILNSKKEEKATIVIYNATGQRIREVYVQTNNLLGMHLDMPGIYFLSGMSKSGNWKGTITVFP